MMSRRYSSYKSQIQTAPMANNSSTLSIVFNIKFNSIILIITFSDPRTRGGTLMCTLSKILAGLIYSSNFVLIQFERNM